MKILYIALLAFSTVASAYELPSHLVVIPLFKASSEAIDVKELPELTLPEHFSVTFQLRHEDNLDCKEVILNSQAFDVCTYEEAE